MKNIRRHGALGLLFGIVCPALWAGEIPGMDGKLDFGLEGLPIPTPILQNNVGPRTVELLAAAASAEKTPFVRMQLLTELGECRSAQGVATLIAALGDSDAGTRATAASAIATSGADDTRNVDSRKALLADGQLLAKLQSLMADADANVAVAALGALVSLQGPSSPAIESALKSAVPQVLSAGIEAASRPEHAKVLAGRMNEIQANLRPRAILALGRCGDQSQAPLLIARAKGQDIQETVAACEALGMLRSVSAAADLERLTEASHASIRREAIRAFGQCSADRRIEVATGRLKDEDPTVRQAAVEVIGANLTPDSVTSIVPQLSTDYEPLYLATRAALISAKDDATRESCIQASGRLLNDASPRRQEDGSYVLGHYRSAHMLERHIQLLEFSMEKPDWKLIAQVALSTGRIGRQEARPALVKLVLSRDKLIAADEGAPGGVNAALIGAGRLASTEILPMCDKILAEDPLRSDGSARMGAAFAMGVAGDANTQGVGRLFNALVNPMDASKIEALKAIGNLKVPGGENRIKEFPGSESHECQWLIQWATARITGRPAEHPPTIYKWKARPSIQDLTAMP